MPASADELIAAGLTPEAAQHVAAQLASQGTTGAEEASPHTPDPVEVLLLMLRLANSQVHRDVVDSWLVAEGYKPEPEADPVTEAPAAPAAPVAPQPNTIASAVLPPEAAPEAPVVPVVAPLPPPTVDPITGAPLDPAPPVA